MTPERQLWCSVLMQTIYDFELKLYSLKKAAKKPNPNYAKRVMMDLDTLWHTTRSPWFEEICDFAGVHSDDFQIAVRRVYVKNRMGAYLPGFQ